MQKVTDYLIVPGVDVDQLQRKVKFLCTTGGYMPTGGICITEPDKEGFSCFQAIVKYESK